ncbi:MAG: hypothetical protein NXI21_03735 [Alphaproteobacteria bacterium]|nr:hypothetical protein [Alphaproteobacteria bacterium]
MPHASPTIDRRPPGKPPPVPPVDTLLKALSDRPKQEALHLGQVVCLGLDAVRARIGEAQWTSAEALVAQLVEKAIRRVCAPEDAFVRCRDGAFVVVFGTPDRAVAAARSAGIAEIVNRALFGEERFKGVTIHTTVRTATGLRPEPGRGADDVLQELLDGAAKRELDPPDPPKRPADPPDGAAADADSAPQEARPTPAPKAIPRRRDAVLDAFKGIDRAPIVFRYLPVWTVGGGRVLLFHCIPTREMRCADASLRDHAVLGPDPANREIAELDMATLEHGLVEHCRRLRDGARQHLSVNLHYETVACSRGRADLAALLGEAPEPVRATLSARLVGLPEGAPEARLAQLAGQLAPYFSALSAMVPAIRTREALPRALQRLRAAGLRSALIRFDRTRAAPDAPYWRRFAEMCQEYGLRPGVCGAPDRESALLLSYAGFALLTGPVLGGPFDRLPAPYRFDARRLEGAAAPAE